MAGGGARMEGAAVSVMERESGPASTRVGDGPGKFIYITGCDGTGKSTQVALLLTQLREEGQVPHHVWLRFPFFFSLPLLAYARWRGYSWHEETEYAGIGGQPERVRHGYWRFAPSPLLRRLLPWTLLVDAALAALPQIYVPLWRGRTVVCERFVLDMLVDLAVAFGDEGFHRRVPGRFFQWLLPRPARVVILDLDVETLWQRRTNLRFDHQLAAKVGAFRRLVEDYGLAQVSSEMAVADVQKQVYRWVRLP